MRYWLALIRFGAIVLAVASTANAAPRTTAARQLPRIVGRTELRHLIRGAYIAPVHQGIDELGELFRSDGSYAQTDGASEGEVGTYYFSGNLFCLKIARKADRCRSVLIDSDKRTWLIEEGAEWRPVRVNISHH